MGVFYYTMAILATKTGKLSYRKDDRVMRPVYGCSEVFGES